MTFSRNIFYAIFSVIFAGLLVYAQTEAPVQTDAPAVKTKHEKMQSINFEDELVEGTAQKPEFLYLFQKKNFNYKRLIRLRENFSLLTKSKPSLYFAFFSISKIE